ncbi:MAG: type I restriction-modification system subunit M N-terminal domain-containing protein [Chthoniobacterales bacterium]
MARARSVKSSNNSSANIGFEQKLWLAADKLRSNMDAAEYKHVVLGLIFLKYISDSFEEHHAKLLPAKVNTLAVIRKIRTSTKPRMCFGSHPLRVGPISRTARNSRRSARLWTTR